MTGSKGGPIDGSTQLGYVIPGQKDDEDDGERTRPLAPAPGAPPVPVALNNVRPSVPDGGESSAVLADQPPRGIEVEYIREETADDRTDGPFTVLEIWTRNRVYHVDGAMRCVAVMSRHSFQPEPANPILGSRLAGGQRRSRSTGAIEIVYPYPMPGTDAVFKHDQKRAGQYAQTSTVERVVLRVRRFRVGVIDAQPAWEELTGRFKAP